MLKGLPASGKGQPASSVIPTPNGDKKIGELKVGNYVFGSDGRPTKVIGVFQRGVLPIYKVSFADGAELVVDGDHIWTFEGRLSRSKNDNKPVKYNYTTKDLYANIALVNPKIRGRICKHLPIVSPLEYNDGKTEIDPYILGLYLADGSCGKNGVPRITKKESGVVEYMLHLPDAPHNKHQYGNNTPYYTYPKGENKLWPYLKKVGLGDKRSAEKFIPEEMFHKSVEIRKRLLHGLMDGDGSIKKNKTSKSRVAVYSTTSEKLKNDMVRLVTGLGGTTLIRLADAKRKPYWQIRIYTEFNPFLATHETEEWKPREYRQNTYRTVKNIEKVGYDEVVCIAVEAPDQLYVADTQYHILTHNTSWAKEQVKNGNYMVVSKDEIRKMFGGYSRRREKEVLRIRNELIRQGIQLRRNVIVDDTNLHPKHERYLKQLATELGAKFEINDSFLEISPEECIKRDLHRGEKAVGASVIWDMFYTWVAPNPQAKLNQDFEKPRCVLVDLDGTLAINVSDRSFYDLTQVGKDAADPFVSCVVDALYNYGIEQNGEPYPKIIILSGREDSCRAETEKWLDKNMIPYDALYMRKAGDKRPDEIVKEEIYHEQIEPNYAVLGVIDDRPAVCTQWRKLGLRVAQVGNPYVEF